MSTSSNFKSGSYLLAPQANTTAVLTLTSGLIFLKGSKTGQTSFTLKSPEKGAAQEFIIQATSKYAEGYVTIAYTSEKNKYKAECHINFFLENTSWNQDTVGSFPKDIRTIIPKKSVTPGTGSPTLIAVTQPTSGNPSGIDTLFQVLNPEMVFLVDYYPENKTLLFRGNTPFNTPKKNNGQQKVDFTMLHEYMENQYKKQTGNDDFPAMGSYDFRDVCLQNRNSEGKSILWELESFGGSKLSQLENQVCFPSEGKHQMCNWEIEPHNIQSNDTYDLEAVTQLSTWMNTKSDTFTIYYIHCASGHDRTGIVASSYLIENRGLSLERSLIYGTTISKLTGGTGQLQVNCTDLDGANKGETDPNRSRIQMISEEYDTTVLNIYNTLNPKNKQTELPEIAMAENPSNVYSTYPWEE